MAKKRGGLPAGMAAARAGVQANLRRVERARGRDPEAGDIAQTVYNIAVELKSDPDADALPLAILAPIIAAAERAAPGAAKMAGINYRDAELVSDVAAYLVAGFREMVVMLKPEHFAEWCEQTNEAEAALQSSATSTTEEGPHADAGDDDGAGEVTSAATRRTEGGERRPHETGEGEAGDEGGEDQSARSDDA